MPTTAAATPIKAAPVSESPGTWRHPRLNEITRRRNVSIFSEKNIRRIGYNLFALLALWSLQLIVRLCVSPQIVPATVRTYVGWAWIAIQLVPVAQISMACLPLFRTPDDLSDIPLTVAQRMLLGLPPSSAPPTPDARFSTPPRYSRTPSIAGSVGSRASYASSPLSGRGSPAFQASAGGSPSPYSASGGPLLQKSTNGAMNGHKSPFSPASPFGAPSSASLFSDSASPGSPSPSAGKRTSVGLNSKWLYEKGRRSSGGGWLH
ncbi:uncharacterized protein DCS_05731 [Drechmeria coniospora]|uniref:Nuclear pore complex component n=1 Tax=Drechmeria coniospora TaxID=98403 RepID=A0A151GNL6_DRECN|nr:uncharacterized protein DCS_05731 [Drechmeria coniospora]KYK58714.1 uncharacterized protein DCS_05731 [Drechmeria coniospora]